MEIRRAWPQDGPSVLALVLALADYEKLDPPTEQAQERLLKDAFGPDPRLEIWVAADDGGALVAYAAVFETYSTFRAKQTLYLEDLFVHPDARRQGIGSQMMQTLLAEAKARNCGRFEWTVLDWNTGAQSFYDQLGARQLEAWRIMRVDLP